VGDHLQAAAEDARLAFQAGNRPQEVGGLSRTIGEAKALMAMTSSCDTCSDVRDELQQIIGIAALLKAPALGNSATCHPDGSLGQTNGATLSLCQMGVQS